MMAVIIRLGLYRLGHLSYVPHVGGLDIGALQSGTGLDIGALQSLSSSTTVVTTRTLTGVADISAQVIQTLSGISYIYVPGVGLDIGVLQSGSGLDIGALQSPGTGNLLYATVAISQMDQETSVLPTFILVATASWSTASSFVPTDTYHPLGTEYVYMLKSNLLDDIDFTQIPSGSFTLSGKTSRSGTGNLGRILNKMGYGVSRADENLFSNPMQEIVSEEWQRFPLFVNSDFDFTQISTSFGFSLSGASSIGGQGIAGRDIEDYVTLSLVTNVLDTQTLLEILVTGNPHVRATQVLCEYLWQPVSQVRNTQTVAEILYLANIAVIDQMAVEALQDAVPNAVLSQAALEVIYAIHANCLATQVVAEMLVKGNPDVRLTQVVAEIITRTQLINYSDALINQAAIEALQNANPNALVAAVATEAMFNDLRNAQINAAAVEVMNNGTRNACVEQVTVECVRFNLGNIRCGQIAIELLVSPEFDPEVAALVNNPHYVT
jgi:hypothetical protein